MNFETLNSGKFLSRKWVLVSISVVVLVLFVIGTYASFAKYQTVKSMAIVSGTINYRIPDFELVAMYQQKANQTCTTDSCYSEINTMPTSGYKINTTKSYCNVNNTKDTGAKLYTNSNGEHIIGSLKRGSKCYLWFDNEVKDAGTVILGNVTSKDSATSFTGVATTDEGVFKTKDDDGDTYYWRGAVNNNYVRFANKWWRIIRINGDGSIRLIYDGTSGHANGTNTADSIAVASQTFSPNGTYNNNMYVGFKYTVGELHGLGTKSNALVQLETWYQNNLSSYANKIDTDAGFCGDREPSTIRGTSNGSGGTGTTTTYYGAYIRILNSSGSWNTTQTPTFKCKNSSDLYTLSSSTKGNKSLTYPIGLITADEVVYAGGFGGTANQSYYLYNGQSYWSLSPWGFDGSHASVFCVYSTGLLGIAGVDSTIGVRPVINLKANTTFTGKGTISDPYVVS